MVSALVPIWSLTAYLSEQRLDRSADLGRDRRDCCPRLLLIASVAAHGHGALDDFGGYIGWSLSSILSNNGAHTKPITLIGFNLLPRLLEQSANTAQ